MASKPFVFTLVKVTYSAGVLIHSEHFAGKNAFSKNISKTADSTHSTPEMKRGHPAPRTPQRLVQHTGL